MGNFSNYWDLHTLFTKIKNKIKSVSDSIPTKVSQLTNDSGYTTNTGTVTSVKVGSTSYNPSSGVVSLPAYPNVTKTSQLTNDSNFVADSSYVHTDNNYTTTEKNKLSGIASGAEANVQSDWNQTTTTADDYIKNKPTIPTALSDLTADATHRLVTDTEKSTWNGKSNFSGSYNDLTNKPTIPTALSQLTADSTHRLVTDTEKNTWNNKATSTDITNAINALDVSSVGGSGKYISAISETDGKISATATDITNLNPLISPYEAYLQWGGQNFTGSYGCIDAAMISDLNANRFFGIRAAGITIEYTRDGGSTWTDYGASDFAKQTLFTNGTGFYIGKADGNNKATANGTNYQLRVTINTPTANVYTELKKIVLYISTNGSSNCTCKVQGVLKENSSDTGFIDITSDVSISGWSGYNVINTSFVAGSSFNGQYRKVRFLFKANGGDTKYVGLNVQRIMAYGGVGWTTPSTMARTGHLYESDANLKATFPAELEATALYENGTALSSKYASATDVPFKFGVDSSGNYGYIKAGADTVTPFKTVGTRSSNITANGTYTASSDISKDGYSSVTVAVPNSVQTKTVTPGTSQMFVTPDAGYIGLSQVTINVANNQYKTVHPTVAAQIVRPDTGYWLSGVTVDGIPTQEKSVTPSTSAQTVTPDSGMYLTSVSVGAISTQTKSVTPSTSAQTVTPDSGKYLTSVSVGAISTQTKSVTATTSSQTVTPDSGKYLSSVTVYPQQHTETIRVSANGTTSMGDTHNYKIVDSSGAYSAGYAARAPVTLWTNPSPTAEFGVKTLTISGLKNYSYIAIIGRLVASNAGYHNILGGFEPNNLGTTWTVGSPYNGSSYMGVSSVNFALQGYGTFGRMRWGYYNGSTQITISNACYLNVNSGSGSPGGKDNSYYIPEKIIGFK